MTRYNNFTVIKVFNEVKSVKREGIEKAIIKLKAYLPKKVLNESDKKKFKELENFYTEIQKIKKPKKELHQSDLDKIKQPELPYIIWFNFAEQILADIIWIQSDFEINEKGELKLKTEWRNNARDNLVKQENIQDTMNDVINKIASELDRHPIQFIGEKVAQKSSDNECKEIIDKLKESIKLGDSLIEALKEIDEKIDKGGKSLIEIKKDYKDGIETISMIMDEFRQIGSDSK